MSTLKNWFRCLTHILIALPLLLAAAAPVDADAGEMRSFAHPDRPMEIRDYGGWRIVARPGDPGTSEWAQDNTDVHVLMWFTSTEMNAERYLRKMASMMDLDLDAEPYARTIDERPAWVLGVPGRVESRPVRTILAVVHSGHSSERPKENLLYVFQFHCPAADSTDTGPAMRRMLDQCRVTDGLLEF